MNENETVETEQEAIDPEGGHIEPLVFADFNKREIWIDGNNEIWEDTPFYEKGMRVKIALLDSGQQEKIKRRFIKLVKGRQILDDTGFSRAVFLQACLDWEVKLMQDGKEIDLECSQENKKKVAQFYPMFADRVAAVAITSKLSSEGERDSEQGN